MALLEINLEKPALIEEIADEQAAGGSTFGLSSASTTGRQQRSGGSALRKLGMVGAMIAVVAVARALQGRQSSSTNQSQGVRVPIQDGSSGQGGQSQRLRVLGMVLAVVGAVVAARRMQNGSRR